MFGLHNNLPISSINMNAIYQIHPIWTIACPPLAYLPSPGNQAFHFFLILAPVLHMRMQHCLLAVIVSDIIWPQYSKYSLLIIYLYWVVICLTLNVLILLSFFNVYPLCLADEWWFVLLYMWKALHQQRQFKEARKLAQWDISISLSILQTRFHGI